MAIRIINAQHLWYNDSADAEFKAASMEVGIHAAN